jgi:hypothetical protein
MNSPRTLLRKETAPDQEDEMRRELIDRGNDKRYVRRDDRGRFKDVVDVGRSLSQDQKRDAKNEAKKGEGDRGDRGDA